MRSKDPKIMQDIISFVDENFNQTGRSPSITEISNKLNLSIGCIHKYLTEMKEKGMIENDGGSRGIRTKTMDRKRDVEFVPVVGKIACGPKMFAEQNIERYLPVPKGLLGYGKHFALVANGESMIDAGINDGDYVFARMQNTAEEGQIIVALVDDEATLKRYYLDKKRKQVRLHPENNNMEDMFFNNVVIQGVAVKVMKDLF
ncbi:MAG: transcriptional repressor LexA [Candidatus Caccovivens sp.]